MILIGLSIFTIFVSGVAGADEDLGVAATNLAEASVKFRRFIDDDRHDTISRSVSHLIGWAHGLARTESSRDCDGVERAYSRVETLVSEESDKRMKKDFVPLQNAYAEVEDLCF